MAKDIVPAGQFGPVYPDLASVKKFRGALATMTREQRQAYGAAVEQAIRALQRSALRREKPDHRVNCASGTNHNDGREISKAMRAKHRAALAAAPSQERRARSPQVWQSMYDAAMADKRQRALDAFANSRGDWARDFQTTVAALQAAE